MEQHVFKISFNVNPNLAVIGHFKGFHLEFKDFSPEETNPVRIQTSCKPALAHMMLSCSPELKQF